MLNNATCFKNIVLITGRTDLRKGINGLADIIKYQYDKEPFALDTLYMFCGTDAKKMKAIVWEGDGFLLLVKRLEAEGRYRWPRNKQEAMNLSQEQFEWLMKGLEVVPGIQPYEHKLTI